MTHDTLGHVKVPQPPEPHEYLNQLISNISFQCSKKAYLSIENQEAEQIAADGSPQAFVGNWVVCAQLIQLLIMGDRSRAERRDPGPVSAQEDTHAVGAGRPRRFQCPFGTNGPSLFWCLMFECVFLQWPACCI